MANWVVDPWQVGYILVVLAALIGALNCLNQRGMFYLPETLRRMIVAFDNNATTELASIAITILVVDRLYQHRETEREKKQLILQMGSPDNGFALEAVRALRAREWLQKGAAKNAILRGCRPPRDPPELGNPPGCRSVEGRSPKCYPREQ